MGQQTIDKATSNKIRFLAHIVPAFADVYKMNVQDAFFYLKKHGGWEFLNAHWQALHTENTTKAVRDIYQVCHQNGGMPNESASQQSTIMNYPETNRQTISREMSDRISFVTYIVPAFADAYKMNAQDAFFYLKKYGGWDFLNEHWWALHTDNEIWAVRDIYEICVQNGGRK